MPSQSLLICFILLLLTELMRTGTAAQALALALTLILTLAAYLLVLELDALGALVLSTYAAVFVFLALLSAHFGPFAQRAARPQAARWLILLNAGIILINIVCLSVIGAMAINITNPAVSALWQELYQPGLGGLTLSGDLFHWFFYRVFVFETVLLNSYLFLALAAALSLLALSQAWQLPHGIPKNDVTSARLRAPANVRRQGRRRNSSRIRHK